MKNPTAVHDPDRFMSDLRHILTQGRKRVGFLIGAGAPFSIKKDGEPLIPNVADLTAAVLDGLDHDDREVAGRIQSEFENTPNIEDILTRVRRFSQALGNYEVCGWNGARYGKLADSICEKIGKLVNAELPTDETPFSELISWIGGVQRDYSVEIFTTNYDLLVEEAFERARFPYFDGFTGSHNPFFDSATITANDLPDRWSRLWKIHGSLGWKSEGSSFVRTGNREDSHLIYPDHLKYDHINRLPYSALFERFRTFLLTPDSLLICTGFSFSDAQITAVIEEALAANAHAAVFAFQYGDVADNPQATTLAMRRPNFSLYARREAIVSGVPGAWQPGKSQKDDWEAIRKTYWTPGEAGSGGLILGDFVNLARFCALAQADTVEAPPSAGDGEPIGGKSDA